MRYLTREDLRGRGLNWSATHFSRKMREGTFPRAVKLGRQDRLGRNYWPQDEIDLWFAEKRAARDRRLAEAARAAAVAPCAPPSPRGNDPVNK